MIADLVRRVKTGAATMWLAARDPRVPVVAKVIAGVVAAYAFSPIDLIPDFIPVLGLLDDLIILPIGIWLASRLIPGDLLAVLRTEAEVLADKPVSKAGLVIVLAIWGLLAWWAWRVFA